MTYCAPMRCQPCSPVLRARMPMPQRRAPRTVARFTENSFLTDLMPLLTPNSLMGMGPTSLMAPGQMRPRTISRRGLRPIVIDVKETSDGYTICADLPGIAKENVRVDYERDMLNISVEQKEEKEDEEKEEKEDGLVWHRVERSTQFARRSMRLPEVADLENMQARMQDGVLMVHVPKKPEVQPPSKRIEIA